MSKNEILLELPKLDAQDRREIWLRLGEMDDLAEEECDDDALSPEEIALIDARIAALQSDPQGSIPLDEYKARWESAYQQQIGRRERRPAGRGAPGN